MSEDIKMLSLASLRDNPKDFFHPLAADQLADLTESIARSGILHPLVVRPRGDAYEIISGHQRKRAAEALGMTEVPARVVKVDDARAEVMLIDANVQTRELTTMEKARAVRRLKELFQVRNGARGGATSAQCAEVVGVSERQFRKLDKLNDLIPELQSLIDVGKLGLTAGEKLAALSPEVQRALYDVLGEEIGRIQAQEAARFKEEADRAQLVLRVLEARAKEVEEQLKQVTALNGDKEELEKQLAQLREKKRKAQYDLADAEAAAKALQRQVEKKGASLVDLLDRLARPLAAARPELLALAAGTLDPGLVPHVRKHVHTLKEAIQILEPLTKEDKTA
ncbi:MAG: ParB/RepB/Spo0J family partition protein [Bacillota bacterium]